MYVGAVVRWYTKDGGWSFGRFVAAGPTWARVAQDGRGTTKRVLVKDLQVWPPNTAFSLDLPRDKSGKVIPGKVKRSR